MRITNDCSPEELLCELLAAGQRTKADTAKFAEDEWSNHDILCDRIAERVEAMLNCYERLGKEVHVTQGMNDNGVDVYLKFGNKKIGIQVKSNREAVRNTKRGKAPSMELTLKAQALETTRWELDELWIFLCFDLTNQTHVKLVQRINAGLKQVNLGRTQIKIFSPRQVLRLLSLDDDAVEALCTLRLCHEDEMLVGAQRELADLSPEAHSVVLNTIFGAIDQDARSITWDEIAEAVDSDFDGDPDGEVNLMSELSGYLNLAAHDDTYEVKFNEFPFVSALYLSIKARQHAGTQAAEFVQLLLNPSEIEE